MDLKKALRFIEKFQEHPQKRGLVRWSVGQFIFRTICTTLSPHKTYNRTCVIMQNDYQKAMSFRAKRRRVVEDSVRKISST